MTGRLVMLFLSLGPAIVAAEISVDLEACMAQTDDASRLRCYDDRLKSASTAGQPVLTDTETSESVSNESALEAEFGKEARLEDQKEQLSELHATVVSIDRAGRDKRLFALDNDQVWAETGANRRLKVEPGDRVRVRPGSLGSFRLFVEGGRVSTRVERIK